MSKILTVILPTFWTIHDEIYKQYGGLEPRTLAVAKFFADLDYNVNVIAPRGSHLSHKNITILSGNHRAWTGSGLHPYDLEKDMILSNIEEIKQSDAVLEDIHFHYLSWLKSQKPQDYPKVAWSMDFHPDQINSLPNHPQNIIAVSKWVMSAMREKFKNQNHNFYHAYSGLILENYPKDIDFKNKEDNLYLFLARFSSVKAPHIILELARENPNDEFVMLGDVLFAGEYQYIRQIKENADTLDNVKVIFNGSYKEKITYLEKAKGILHPGQWHEPLGLDTLEGLYFGAKALAFDCGSAREIYQHEKHGLIIPFSDNENQNIEFYKRGFRQFKKLNIKPEVCKDRILSNFDFKKHSFGVYKKVLFD